MPLPECGGSGVASAWEGKGSRCMEPGRRNPHASRRCQGRAVHGCDEVSAGGATGCPEPDTVRRHTRTLLT
jgi:hypothetical protein